MSQGANPNFSPQDRQAAKPEVVNEGLVKPHSPTGFTLNESDRAYMTESLKAALQRSEGIFDSLMQSFGFRPKPAFPQYRAPIDEIIHSAQECRLTHGNWKTFLELARAVGSNGLLDRGLVPAVSNVFKLENGDLFVQGLAKFLRDHRSVTSLLSPGSLAIDLLMCLSVHSVPETKLKADILLAEKSPFDGPSKLNSYNDTLAILGSRRLHEEDYKNLQKISLTRSAAVLLECARLPAEANYILYYHTYIKVLSSLNQSAKIDREFYTSFFNHTHIANNFVSIEKICETFYLYLNAGWSLNKLFDAFESCIKPKKFHERVLFYGPAASAKGLSVDLITVEGLPTYDESFPEMWARIVSEYSATSPLLPDIVGAFSDLTKFGVEDFLVDELGHALRQNKALSERDLTELVRELKVHSIKLAFIGRGSSAWIQESISDLLNSVIKNDHIPFYEEDVRAPKMRSEIQNGFKRMIDESYSFDAMTFLCRGMPDGDNWPLVSIASDLGAEVRVANSSSSDHFPGKGVHIQGINPLNIFPSIEQFKEIVAGRNLADEVDLLSKVDLFFARGLKAVGFKDKTLSIVDIPYTYIVFNDHFLNPFKRVACAVPTHIFAKELEPCLVPLESYRGIFDPKIKDLVKASLTYEKLYAACEVANYPFIDLASGSNLGGSFSNAFPTGKYPYHDWERARRSAGETQDSYGHIHKSHYLGGYQQKIIPALEEFYVEMRKAHDTAYSFITRAQNILDLFNICLGQHSMGVTLDKGWEVEFDQASTEEEEGDSEIPLSTKHFRGLKYIYRMHQGLKSSGVSINSYPIISLESSFNGSYPPAPEVSIDTYSLEIVVYQNGRPSNLRFKLPSSGSPEGLEEQQAWAELVVPKFRNGHILRPYDRKKFPQEGILL